MSAARREQAKAAFTMARKLLAAEQERDAALAAAEAAEQGRRIWKAGAEAIAADRDRLGSALMRIADGECVSEAEWGEQAREIARDALANRVEFDPGEQTTYRGPDGDVPVASPPEN